MYIIILCDFAIFFVLFKRFSTKTVNKIPLVCNNYKNAKKHMTNHEKWLDTV